MADSAAERQRRHRRHRQGDHALCKHDRPAVAQVPVAVGKLDPEAELEGLAAAMREAYLADPGNALLGREYRLTLQALVPPSDGMDAELKTLLADLGRPAPRG